MCCVCTDNMQYIFNLDGGFMSSGKPYCVLWQVAPVIRRHCCNPLKCQAPLCQQHSITSLKTWFLSSTAVRALKLTHSLRFSSLI